ncbi:MAG: hypothetical protein ACT4OM_09195 [Actinomycetota bacterium]
MRSPADDEPTVAATRTAWMARLLTGDYRGWLGARHATVFPPPSVRNFSRLTPRGSVFVKALEK